MPARQVCNLRQCLPTRVRTATVMTPPPEDMQGEVQQAWLRGRLVELTRRSTKIWGFGIAEAEAMAYQAARGVWPDIILTGLFYDEVQRWEVILDSEFDFTLAGFLVEMRNTVDPPLAMGQLLMLAVVKPIPTVDEQQGRDGIYVLAGVDLQENDVLAMVAIWDMRSHVTVDMHPMILLIRIHSELLLQLLGLESRCQISFIVCHISYDGHELPHFIPWQTFNGMKIVIQIRIQQCFHGIENLRLGRYTGASTEEDSVTLMQSHLRRFWDDGCGPNSHQRLARCSDMELSWIVPVRLSQIHMHQVWKYTGRDVVKDHFVAQGILSERLHLHGWIFHEHEQDLGVSFSWGFHSNSPWSMQTGHFLKGTSLLDALMYTVVPQPVMVRPIGEFPSQMQVLVPSDIEERARHLFVLEYSFLALLERLAVRCDRPCTVRELFRKIRFDYLCGSTFRCQAAYRHGSCQAVFYDDQEIKLPFASLVQLEVLKAPTFPCESFQPATAEQIEVSRIASTVVEAGSAGHERIVQQVQTVLSHQRMESALEADDVTDLMQRSLSSPPVTLSTRSAEVSSISGSVQVPFALRSSHQATMYHASMSYLWEYWRSCPWYSTREELYILCVTRYVGGTTSSAQYCPIDYIRPHCTDHNFASWCRGVAPILWQCSRYMVMCTSTFRPCSLWMKLLAWTCPS